LADPDQDSVHDDTVQATLEGRFWVNFIQFFHQYVNLVYPVNRCFRPEENEEFLDAEGFAHMGDLGYYDEEGKLYFT